MSISCGKTLPARLILYILYTFIAQSNRATLHDRLRDQPARRAHPTPGKAVCRIYGTQLASTIRSWCCLANRPQSPQLLQLRRPRQWIGCGGAARPRPRWRDTLARIRRVAGCATPTGSAGHAGATANLKLTFHLDHSAGADHYFRGVSPKTATGTAGTLTLIRHSSIGCYCRKS